MVPYCTQGEVKKGRERKIGEWREDGSRAENVCLRVNRLRAGGGKYGNE